MQVTRFTRAFRRTPTAFNLSAQGCAPGATLGNSTGRSTTPKGLNLGLGRRNETLSRFGASSAFTLLELLAVIAIMGILAAIALPSIRSLKPNAAAAATRQMLDAVTRARQLALSQRTTVYMVFVPPSFWTDTAAYRHPSWTATDTAAAESLLDKQMVGYNYVTLRSVGDQPGVSYPQYLGSWRTLPQGAFIAAEKFLPVSSTAVLKISTNGVPAYQVFGFNFTNNIPFPLETTGRNLLTPPPYVWLPYIAFNSMGQLVSGSGSQPEIIPITEGAVSYPRDPESKIALPQAISLHEVPSGNTTNNYNLVCIDQLTGRGRVEHTKAQ